MKKKGVKIIRIESIMPKALQKQIGLNRLTAAQLADLNAWLNLKNTRAVLGPGDPPKGQH